ncbi:hypothetical protein P3T36_002015 [Kitasatospora sp. MAP12-15]|nr:hypothetical protein [Kitasatospora sp. MAP12-44]
MWVGGNSDAGLRRAVQLGDAWHPLRCTMPFLHEAVVRLEAFAGEARLPVPALAPRIALRPTAARVDGPQRLAGEGTIDQIMADLDELRLLGADTVVLDHYNGDPRETCRPQAGRQALATVAAHFHPPRIHPPRTDSEQS